MGRWGDFVAKFAVLAMGPVAVVGGLWLWLSLDAAAAPPSPLSCRAEDGAVAWLGEPLRIATALEADASGGASAAPPVALLFMLDTSSSTTEGRDELSGAVQHLSRDVLLSGVAESRVALATFDSAARIETAWSADPAAIDRGLVAAAGRTGGTDAAAALKTADEAFGTVAAGARRVLALYTDGEFDRWPELEAGARAMRARGVDIYVIGIPGRMDPRLIGLTGDGRRLLPTSNQSDVTAAFRRVAEATLDARAAVGVLEHKVDGRLFDASFVEAGWALRGGARLERDVAPVLSGATAFHHDLIPRTLGVARTAVQRPAFSYANFKDGAETVRVCEPPKILTVSPLFLLAAFAPALAFLVATALRRLSTPDEEPAPRPFSLRPPSSTAGVLAPPEPSAVPRKFTPTLFIGLGGWGAAAGAEARRALSDGAAAGGGTPPVFFLDVDVDERTAARVRPSPSAGIGVVLPPPPPPSSALHIDRALESLGPSDDPGDRLAAVAARHVGNEEKTTVVGTRGNRLFGRVAFKAWLKDGDLESRLLQAVDLLSAQGGDEDVRQIVVFAHAAGGFGGAVALDVARILQRALAARRRGGEMGTEVIGVYGLSDRPEKRAAVAAVMQEIETARSAGVYPRRRASGGVFSGSVPNFNGGDARPPFDAVLVVEDDGVAPVADGGISPVGGDADVARIGALASVAVDAGNRRALFAELVRPGETATLLRAASVDVQSAVVQKIVADEFIARFIGSHVLGGLEPAHDERGFRPPPVSAADVDRAAARWRAVCLRGDGFGALLAAAFAAGDGSGSGLGSGEGGGDGPAAIDPSPDRLMRDAAESLTALTSPGDGRGAAAGRESPFVVAALLDRFVERARLAAATGGGGGRMFSAQETAALTTAADLLEPTARRIREWNEGLLALVGEAAASKKRLTAQWEKTQEQTTRGQTTGGRTTGGKTASAGRPSPQSAADEDVAGAWLGEVLSAWTGAAGETGAGDRLALAIVGDGGELRPVLRSRLGFRRDFASPDEAVAGLRDIAADVAARRPPARIDREIDRADAATRKAWGDFLTRGDADAESAVVFQPVRAGGRSLDPLDWIVEPPGLPPRLNAGGWDRSRTTRVSRRRLFMPPVDGDLPLVQVEDVLGERLRREIADDLDRRVVALPPELRLAAADVAGLRSFAVAYARGNVTTRIDACGRRRFCLTPLGRFIGDETPRLASALGDFLSLPDPRPPEWPETGERGDFSLLEAQRMNKREPDAADQERLYVLSALHLALEGRI